MTDFEHIKKEDMLEAEREEVTHSDFAMVIFHNVLETYPIDANIECNYTITKRLIAKTSDWVGLYRVGWGSCRDYLMFEWSKLPQDYQSGSDINTKVIFKAQSLPKDDGEFYQFCYVTENNQVRGASTPFQFKRPSAGDFIALEDGDTGLVVIESRRTALEADLRQAARENEQLMREKQHLEEEREGLLERLVKTENLWKQQQQQSHSVKEDLKVQRELTTELAAELDELRQVHASLSEQLEQANQDKQAIEKRLLDNENYICTLRKQVREFANEKDSLSGRARTLQEEKELIKDQWTATEKKMRGHMEEADMLRGQVEKHQKECMQHKQQVVQLKVALEEQTQTLLRQQKQVKADRVQVQSLTEQLQNAEDRLNAAAHSKELLCEELNSMRDTCAKLSDNLNESQIAMKELKEQSAETENKLLLEIATLQEEKDATESSLQAVHNQLQELHDKQDEDNPALMALQMAQADFKRQFKKTRNERDSLKKDLDELIYQKGLVEAEVIDLKRETEDLRERLKMGQEEWQEKYIECRRLQLELKKAQRSASKSRRVSTSSNPASSAVSTESQGSQCQLDGDEVDNGGCASERVLVEAETNTSLADPAAAAAATELEEEVVVDLTNGELAAQLADLAHELEQRTARKLRYKARYQQEREKNALLQRHYFEELNKRDQVRAELEQELHQVRQQAAHERDTLLQRIHLLEFAGQSSRSGSSSPVSKAASPPLAALPCQARYPVLPPPVCEEPSAAKQPQTYAEEPPLSPQLTKEEVEKLAEELDIKLPSDKPQQQSDILPPPIQPMVLPSAKLAELKAACRGPASTPVPDAREEPELLEPAGPPMCDSIPQLEEVVIDGLKPDIQPSAPPTEPDDERFEDALSEPAQQCPVCEIVFPPDVPNMVITDHIDSHLGPECPICKHLFEPGYPAERLQEHVNDHFS